MRLDQYITATTEYSRAEAKKVLRDKRIQVNEAITQRASYHVQPNDEVFLDGQRLIYLGLRYFMLNKPSNYVCSHEDDGCPSVLHLIDEPKAFRLHVAGRLDADTTGLLLITDDGKWSHLLTHPKQYCFKRYRVTLKEPLTEKMQMMLEEGVLLHNETKSTQPAKITHIEDGVIDLSINEGRYHQVKRMLAAVGNKVVKLQRLSIGKIVLDANLKEGEYRPLSVLEINSVYE